MPFTNELLSNKLRLITVPTAGTEAVTLMAFLPVGSRYETPEIGGVSHFIEHLMFKGTDKRPNTIDISRELDSVGAEYNAFTSKEYTGYYIKVSATHLDLAIDVLSDMLTQSQFVAEEIEQEKGVILQELKMYEDNPLMYIEDVYSGLMYQGRTLGRLIVGTRDSIKNITREQIINYRDSFYRPEKLTIALTGCVPANIAEKIVRAFDFKKLTTLESNFSPDLIQSNARTKPLTHVLSRDTEQVQLALGFPGYSYTHPKFTALQVFSAILGGNMSSRLFINVRERRGLAYFVHSEVNPYTDTGDLMIQAGVDLEKLEETTKVIGNELAQITQDGFTDEEINRGKEFLIGKMTLQLEDSTDVAQWYARQAALLGEIVTPQEKIERIRKVDAQMLKSVTCDIIKKENLVAAVIGKEDPTRFAKIIENLW